MNGQPVDVGAGAGIGGLLCSLVLLVIGLGLAVFWIWMLIDCIANEPSGSEKILWVVVIILLNWIGALLYYFIRRPQRGRGS